MAVWGIWDQKIGNCSGLYSVIPMSDHKDICFRTCFRIYGTSILVVAGLSPTVPDLFVRT